MRIPIGRPIKSIGGAHLQILRLKTKADLCLGLTNFGLTSPFHAFFMSGLDFRSCGPTYGFVGLAMRNSLVRGLWVWPLDSVAEREFGKVGSRFWKKNSGALLHYNLAPRGIEIDFPLFPFYFLGAKMDTQASIQSPKKQPGPFELGWARLRACLFAGGFMNFLNAVSYPPDFTNTKGQLLPCRKWLLTFHLISQMPNKYNVAFLETGPYFSPKLHVYDILQHVCLLTPLEDRFWYDFGKV